MKFKSILLVIIAALLALPTMAQQPTTTTVTYNNFSFDVDAAWANHVRIDQFAGDATTVEQPGGPEVKHLQILVSDSDTVSSMFDSVLAIRIYNTADFAAYPTQQSNFEQLQGLLNTRADLSTFTVATLDESATLPFLPVMPASQVIRSRARYIETAAVHGISYVTAYRQDVSPFVSGDFYYTFQGISADGMYYVSIVARPTTVLFPVEISADFDQDTFAAAVVDYINQSIATLNASLETDFTPSLSAFDAVVTSLSFGREMTMPLEPTVIPTVDLAVPTLEPTTEPIMGGLGLSVWTLLSYGAVDAPIATLPEAPVVVTFTAEVGIAGSAGCNSFSGPFTFDVNTLTVGPLISTLMACEEPIMAQETAIMTALQTATSFEVLDGQLRINYPEGVLTFSVSG